MALPGEIRAANAKDGAESMGYCGLMPATLITLAHFAVSSAMSLPKSAGACEHHPAHVGEPLHDLGIGEARVGFPVEVIHDRGGRILRRGDAEPGARLVARYEISDGGDVGQ